MQKEHNNTIKTDNCTRTEQSPNSCAMMHEQRGGQKQCWRSSGLVKNDSGDLLVGQRKKHKCLVLFGLNKGEILTGDSNLKPYAFLM